MGAEIQQESADSASAGGGAPLSRQFAPASDAGNDPSKLTVNEALQRKSVIDSSLPPVGGWWLSQKLLGKTPGERAFNLLDWYGIGYVLNSAISIWAGDRARQGKLWPTFKKVNHSLGNSFFFRDRKGSHPQKFAPLEAEHLDMFVNKVREYVNKESNTGLRDTIKQVVIDKKQLGQEDAANINFEGDEGRRAIRRTQLNHIFAGIDETHHAPIMRTLLEQEIKPGHRLARFGKEEIGELHRLASSAEHETAFAAKASSMFKTLAEDAQALKTSRSNARTWTSFFMLSVGGWALMFPIKWLEDKSTKKAIVTAVDNHYIKHHHLTESQKATIEARHKEIDAEPEQTYASVLTARLISYPIIIASYLTLGPKIKTMDHDGHDSSSWLAKLPGFRKYKGTDHYADKAAGKIDGFLQNKIPAYKRWDESMYKNAVGMEEQFQGSKKLRADSALRRDFSARKGRSEGIVGDTITETVYSLWMVTCTFITSRFTGALFGKKQTPPAPAAPVTAPQEPPAAPVETEKSAPVAQQAAPQPSTKIDALSSWIAKNQSPDRPTEPARA